MNQTITTLRAAEEAGITPDRSLPPRWNSPLGPVWVVKPDTGPVLRVRSVASTAGLLKLGVTLRSSATAQHPRLQPPTSWWQDGAKSWVAAPLPSGDLLNEKRPGRLTWSEALEVLTPLAGALKNAHRRGFIHGALSPWTTFFDGESHRLTAVDFGMWSLEAVESGAFCPPELRLDAGKRRPSPASDIHNLARLLIFLALSPEESIRSRPNFETLPAFAINTLERAIQPDPARRPQTIDEFLSGLSFRVRTTSPLNVGAISTLRSGRVRAIESFHKPGRGEGIRFLLDELEGESADGVFLYRDQQPEVFDSLTKLWEGAELNLIAPRIIEDSQGREFLTADENTLAVLEPHWPVSVSDVLTARGCPQRVLVDLRDSGELTHHLAFGNLVHGFLEDLTADDSLGFDDVLKRRLPERKLDFLAAGVDDAKLARLIEDARRHFEHLRRFTARRTRGADDRDRVGWSGEHAEATRYSTVFGLEGRTDLVVTDPDQGLQIIELKSGKPWHDHAGQVQSYALLWKELARREGMSATGFLLYSKTGRMTEVRLDDDGGVPSLVQGRNGLIALYRSLIEPEYDFRPPAFMDEPALCRQNACRFRRDRCQAQSQLLGLSGDAGGRADLDEDLMRRARLYQGHLTRLIELERWTDHLELGSIFQPQRLAERQADGRTATDLTLTAKPDAPQRALLDGANLHIFSPGDRLLVHRGPVDSTHLLRGRVVAVDRDGRVELSLYSGTLTQPMLGGGWTADRLPARVGYRTAHRGLYRLIERGEAKILQVLFRPFAQEAKAAQEAETTQESEEQKQLPSLDDRSVALLNPSQQSALRFALQSRPATLIQGPPGTGKTTVIAHLALELAAQRKRVVLAALTNTAVDTMLVKLIDAAMARGDAAPPPFLRLTAAEKSPQLVRALKRHGLDPAHYFADDLARHTGNLSAIAEYLDDARIIATTAHSALRHPAMVYIERHHGRPAFDVALIDEASQLTEPMALATISSARRFVLVGDHRQLPPIVTSERALSAFFADDQIAPQLREAGLAGLDQSLFERLARFIEPQMLTTQYRMHRSIMGFPARSFYEGRLIAHDSVAEHRLHVACEQSAEQTEAVDPAQPVVFVDVDGTESGRTNYDEARAVLEVARQIKRSSPEASIGIISPFRAQVHLLRRLQAEQAVATSAEVDTIERFQGNERDVILVSLVKRNQPGDFLADPRRLNVALTRARKKLILFGARSCLEQDPTFRQWLNAPETLHVSWKSSPR